MAESRLRTFSQQDAPQTLSLRCIPFPNDCPTIKTQDQVKISRVSNVIRSVKWNLHVKAQQ